PAEKCGLRLHARRAETIGRGICIGVERRIVDRPTAARPESGARNLVRICLLCDCIRQIGHPTRVTRCWTSRKARHSEIEASPKEVKRTRFAEKTSTEMRKNFLRRKDPPPKAIGIVGVIGRVHGVLFEWNTVSDFARRRTDGCLNSKFAKRNHHVFIELCDAHRLEHHLTKLSFAEPDPKHMINEIKINLEIAVAPGYRRGR